MNKEISIKDFSPHLFWDVDVERFDLDIHKSQLIHKVLEFGKLEDWHLIKAYYGLETIKNVALHLRSLDDVTLSFVASYFNLDKENFRCYKLRQSNPNYWS